MKFNEGLLEEYSEDERPLVKFVLFTLHEDLNLIHFLNKNLEQNAKLVLNKLFKKGLIYIDSSSKLRVDRPIYVHENISFEHDVDIIRKYFSKKYCKLEHRNLIKSQVEILVSDFMRNHPNYTFEEIDFCCKTMVDKHVKVNNQYLPSIDKYINSPKGLLLDLEEAKFEFNLDEEESDSIFI